MAAPRLPAPGPRAGQQGFTLLEVLVALFIVSIAVFPMLEIIQRSEMAAFDAKFTSLACGTARNLLSEITANAVAGDFGEGDLSSLSDEEGFDDRFAFSNVFYEWKVEAVDLSTDILPEDDEEEGSLGSSSQDTDPFKSPDEDEEIDERFRARYVRIVLFYELESGLERELVVETFVPAIPRKLRDEDSAPQDAVAPNTGS